MLGMPRSANSILRHRQVLMYRAARSLVELRILFLAVAIVLAIVSTSIFIAIAISAIFDPTGLIDGTMLASFARSEDIASELGWMMSIYSVAAAAIAFACLRWPRLLLLMDRILRRGTTHRRERGRSLIRLLSAAFGVIHALLLLTPLIFLAQTVNKWMNAADLPSHITVVSPPPFLEAVLFLCVYYGSTLLAIFLIIVRGRGRRCARCSYSLTSWRASANRCPECGNQWKRLGGTRYGTRLHRAWLYSGVALLLAAASIWAFVPL